MIDRAALMKLARVLEGVPILGCLPGTPAALAGVRYGDVLLAVNGMRTRTVVDFVEAKWLDETGMRVVIFRDGVEQTFQLTYAERSKMPVDPKAILAELAQMRILSHETEPKRKGEEPS